MENRLFARGKLCATGNFSRPEWEIDRTIGTASPFYGLGNLCA
jgi:hypothetical protein